MIKQWIVITSAVTAGVLLGGVLLLSIFVWVGGASAQTPTPNADAQYKQMLEMMDTMHGAGTSARMLQVEGGEQMIRACAQTMPQMASMNGAMMSGMMGGMMNGAGNMQDMMRQMMGGTP